MGETNPEAMRERDEKRQASVDDILERIVGLETSMKEERQEAEAKIRERIDAIEANIAARKAYHVQEDKVRPVSPARICAGIAGIRQGLGNERAIKAANAEYDFDIIRQHEEIRTRTQVAGTDSSGGYWVPEQYLPQEFVDTLRAEPVIYKLGARLLTGLVGSPVVIPKKTGNSTAYWVAEGARITGSTLTAGQINLEPHACACLVRMSNRLRMLSNPSVEAMVNEDIARTLALKVEVAALRGDGASGSPLGLQYAPAINTVTTTSINVTNLALYAAAIEADNAMSGNLKWLMNPRPYYTYMGKYRTKHSEAQGIGTAGPGAAFPETLIGFPLARSTNVKATGSGATDVVLGDWSQLVVAQWDGVSFAVSTEADTAFVTNETWVRAIMEVDVGVRQPTAFCYNSSVTD